MRKVGQVYTVQRPEGGAERNLAILVNHRCVMAQMLRAELGDEAPSDEVWFEVGHHGLDLPAGVPFEVVSSQPCGACGKYLKSRYQWSAPKIWTPV